MDQRQFLEMFDAKTTPVSDYCHLNLYTTWWGVRSFLDCGDSACSTEILTPSTKDRQCFYPASRLSQNALCYCHLNLIAVLKNTLTPFAISQLPYSCFDNIYPVLKTVHWLPIQWRVMNKVALVTCKILQTAKPECLALLPHSTVAWAYSHPMIVSTSTSCSSWRCMNCIHMSCFQLCSSTFDSLSKTARLLTAIELTLLMLQCPIQLLASSHLKTHLYRQLSCSPISDHATILCIWLELYSSTERKKITGTER